MTNCHCRSDPSQAGPGPGGAAGPGQSNRGAPPARRVGLSRAALAQAVTARMPPGGGRPGAGWHTRPGPASSRRQTLTRPAGAGLSRPRLSLTHSEIHGAGLGTGNNGPGRRHGPGGPAARAGLPPTAARRPVPRSPGPGPGERPPVPASLPACGR